MNTCSGLGTTDCSLFFHLSSPDNDHQDISMKFPRFLGGFAVGAGWCYLMSPVNIYISTRPNMTNMEDAYAKLDEQINIAAQHFPEYRAIRSLRDKAKEKDIELLRLTRALREKIDKQEAENYPPVDKRTRSIRSMAGLLQRDLDHKDHEIKWFKKQLGEEDELQGEEP